MSILHLADRALVRLSGADAESLLQRLITTDMDDVALGEAGYGALLSPQGKIIVDFLVSRRADGFVFDLDKDILGGRGIIPITFENLRGIRDDFPQCINIHLGGATIGKGWRQ